MPPHCDSMDGPVVKAAMKALEAQDVNLILPYVPQDGEEEVMKTFEKVTRVRKQDAAAKEVADLYFFETVVRIHRAGEGAPFTGLKPAGLDVGPVIPATEKAIETGSPDQLLDLLSQTVRSEAKHRFEQVMRLKGDAPASVHQAREYVQAMLGFQVWSHSLYECVKAKPHAPHHGHA